MDNVGSAPAKTLFCSEKFSQKNYSSIVSKPHEKRSVARSQLQVISQLTAGVNILADINAKRLKMEEKDLEPVLQFRKEEVEKVRKHEKKMAVIYFQFMSQSNHTRNIPTFPISLPVHPIISHNETMQYDNSDNNYRHMLSCSTPLVRRISIQRI